MASYNDTPETLDLTLKRGDSKSLRLGLTDENDAPLTGLTADGWKAQVRAKATNAANVDQFPVLMEFSVDTSEIADGVITLSWTGEEIDALPKKAYWDLQQNDLTYTEGIVNPTDQVSR